MKEKVVIRPGRKVVIRPYEGINVLANGWWEVEWVKIKSDGTTDGKPARSAFEDRNDAENFAMRLLEC